MNLWNNERSYIITNNDRRTNSRHYLLSEDSKLSPELSTLPALFHLILKIILQVRYYFLSRFRNRENKAHGV